MLGNESDFLKGLTPDDSKLILALGKPRALNPGDVLFDLADEATSLYLVVEGRVDLTLPLRVGGEDEHVSVEERGKGQMLGWSALVAPYRFTLRATASTDTELLSFPREGLQGLFSSRPDLGLVVMSNLAAIVGQRFQVFQAMWLRQVQRALEAGNA